MRLEQIEPIRAFRGMSQAAPVGPKTAVVRNLESNLTCRDGLHAGRERARAHARTSQNLAVSRNCANVSSSCLFSIRKDKRLRVFSVNGPLNDPE